MLVQRYMPSLSCPTCRHRTRRRSRGVGEDVTRFKTGDRVVPIYTQGWHAGMPTLELRTQRTLGGPLPGVLQDYIVVPAEDAVSAPAHLSHEEAATLPIAAVTAWSTLTEGGIKAGDTVLVEGTGGVALFALHSPGSTAPRDRAVVERRQAGARRQLGADVGINYRTTPEWNVAVREATHGRGVDIVVETAGSPAGRSRWPRSPSAASSAWSASSPATGDQSRCAR